jgi:hypothetical protein
MPKFRCALAALAFSAALLGPHASTASAQAAVSQPTILSGPFKKLTKLEVRIDRAAPAPDGTYEVFVTFRNPTRAKQAANAAAQRLSGVSAKKSFITAEYALYPVSGERKPNSALPVPMFVAPSGELKARYVFAEPVFGELSLEEGQVTQTYTPAG